MVQTMHRRRTDRWAAIWSTARITIALSVTTLAALWLQWTAR